MLWQFLQVVMQVRYKIIAMYQSNQRLILLVEGSLIIFLLCWARFEFELGNEMVCTSFTLNLNNFLNNCFIYMLLKPFDSTRCHTVMLRSNNETQAS